MSPMKLVLRRSRAAMAKKRAETRDVHAKLFFLTIVPLNFSFLVANLSN